MARGEIDLRVGAVLTEYVPFIASSMRRQNAIQIMDRLYKIGEMTHEDYTKNLIAVLNDEGYIWKKGT